MYHAIVIAFGRAIAEVGAVIMVGGNIAGKTRVMTTSIVLETSKGNMEQAAILGSLLLMLSLALVGLASMVRNRRKRTTGELRGDDLPTPTNFGERVSRTISVTRSDRSVVNNIDVNLAPGTITAIVGESGAGKSTLLRALAGLEGTASRVAPACIYVQQEPVTLTPDVVSELMLPNRLFPSLTPSGRGYAELFQLNDS